MTDTEAQTLCRDIAELGGHEVYPPAQGCVEEFIIQSSQMVSIYAYLTNPAETLRMEKELLRAGWRPGYDHISGKEFFWNLPGRAGDIACLFSDADYQIVTAEAYMAMLLAKKEHGRGGEAERRRGGEET